MRLEASYADRSFVVGIDTIRHECEATVVNLLLGWTYSAGTPHTRKLLR